MTEQLNSSAILSILELLIDHNEGDSLREALEQLHNSAMLLERARHLQANAYERTPNRKGQANGFKSKQLETRVGTLDLRVPQVRDSSFYPSCLEKGCRSERAYLLSLAEMYVQGVSTRKVTKIVEQMCGHEVSSTEVSRACQLLDESLMQWRERPLGEIVYLYLDARYEKVRHAGHVVDCAVLCASGVDGDGFRHLLGVSVALSEAEAHWRSFLEALLSRGMQGVKLIISDAHSGLKAAKTAVLPSVPWQRCHFHLQQNVQSYIPTIGLKKPVGEAVRSVLTAPDLETAKQLLNKAVKQYEEKAPGLAAWLEKNIPEGFSHFSFPSAHYRKIRTNNMLERVNREIKRRTRVAGLFPNESSCLRLVTAVIAEISDEWAAGKRYLVMNE